MWKAYWPLNRTWATHLRIQTPHFLMWLHDSWLLCCEMEALLYHLILRASRQPDPLWNVVKPGLEITGKSLRTVVGLKLSNFDLKEQPLLYTRKSESLYVKIKVWKLPGSCLPSNINCYNSSLKVTNMVLTHLSGLMPSLSPRSMLSVPAPWPYP